MSVTAILPLVLILVCSLDRAQTDCPLLEARDLGNDTTSTTTGLIAASLAAMEPEGTNVSIQLLDYNIVCLAQGSGRDLYRMVSVIASYMSDDDNLMVNVTQFHFECGNGAWSINVMGDVENSISNTTLVGDLTTPLRRDCSLCVDTIPSSAAEHCVGMYCNT